MKYNKEILLSIIIPIYNVEQYLKETLENVLGQSFRQFELILVDDGSTDESANICDHFAKLDSRVCVIHQQNAGVSAARNVGVACAKGKYVGFVDSDDLIEPNMYETLVSIAEQYQADIIQCRHNRLNSVQNTKYSGEKRIIDGYTFVKEIFDYQGKEYTNQVALWSKIYRRELFSGIIFPDGRTYEDEQETYKICLKAQKFIEIPDELYHYVKRDNSIITGISAKKMLDKQLALSDRVNYLPTQIPELKEKCIKSFYTYSIQTLTELYKGNEHNFYKQCKKILLKYREQWFPYINNYDKIYWVMMKIPILESWIMKNDFEPLQRIRRNGK